MCLKEPYVELKRKHKKGWKVLRRLNSYYFSTVWTNIELKVGETLNAPWLENKSVERPQRGVYFFPKEHVAREYMCLILQDFQFESYNYVLAEVELIGKQWRGGADKSLGFRGKYMWAAEAAKIVAIKEVD